MYGVQLPPQVIVGDPVAAYISDKTGTGFCGSSRQAVFFSQDIPNFGYTEYDPGNIFGTENNIIPDQLTCRTVYAPNAPTNGLSVPNHLNCFFDGGFFPSQAGGPIHHEQFPSFLSTIPQSFDFSTSSDRLEQNGDFHTVFNGTLIIRGIEFPIVLNANGQNFDPTLPFPKNVYKNIFWAQTFPEASNDDIMRDTATRFRFLLNVPPEWVNKQVVFGIYADDGASFSIFDKVHNEYPIISVFRNRCEPCYKDQFGNPFGPWIDKCLTPGYFGTPTSCQGVQFCLSDDDCAARGNGPCNLSTHLCTAARCKTDADCGCKPGEKCGDTSIFKFCTLDTHICSTQWCQSCDPTKTGMRWRVTNHVLFTKPGLYPVEILHTQYVGSAALEVSYRVLNPGETFTDIYDSFGFPILTSQHISDTYFLAHSPPLSNLGFQLLDSTMMFQTTTGEKLNCAAYGQCSVQDPSICQDSSFRNPPFPNPGLGCTAGTSCNPAGLCQPCTTNDACGDITCEKCKGNQTCAVINGHHQCADCSSAADCLMGQACQNGQCICKDDSQCLRGQTCKNGHCETCSTGLSCAGNSCSCCAGKANKCLPIDAKNPASYSCVECQKTQDCNPSSDPNNRLVCDPVNHRCVDTIPTCNTDKHCGTLCQACPAERPLCLNGAVCVQCRTDFDCPDANYCLSGQCTACNMDRKCGAQCRSCPQNQPFCFAPNDASAASCVACFKDEQCGEGSSCDMITHQCTNACSLTCPKDQFCQGNRCVQCISSAQCSCGQSCDLASNTCVGGCQDTSDCLPDECCSEETHQCNAGHCLPGGTLHGGALCCGVTEFPEILSPSSFSQTPPWHIVFGVLCFVATVFSLGIVMRRKKIGTPSFR